MDFFFKEINTFIQQRCIKMIKINSKQTTLFDHIFIKKKLFQNIYFEQQISLLELFL